jgi:hypothetical protein
LVFFVPGHLNRFQGLLIRFLRVVFEVWERHDPGMHIGEADRERVSIRMFFHQPDRDIFRVVPFQIHDALIGDRPEVSGEGFDFLPLAPRI